MPLRQVSPESIDANHPARVFAEMWTARARDGKPLSRSDFDPLEVPEILRWTMILERLGPLASAQYRYRFCGDGCADLTGYDYTGHLLGYGIMPEGAAERRKEFLRVLTRRRPEFSATELPVEGREFLDVYRAVFPVTTAKGHDQVFVILAPIAAMCLSLPPGGEAGAVPSPVPGV